jgi:hypothetical protein
MEAVTEWWTDCGDGGKAQEAKEKAEAIRLKIIDLLKAKVSEAEAEYFNTPKAAEPFPHWTTLKYCPENILINQFAYRLERLGEIILRIKQRGGGVHGRSYDRNGTNSTSTPYQSARVRQRDDRVCGRIALRFGSVHPRSPLEVTQGHTLGGLQVNARTSRIGVRG